MEVWKIIFLSKRVIRRFHVNLPGCWFCFVLGVPSRERSHILFKAGKITFPLPLRWDMLVPRKRVLMYTVLSIIMCFFCDMILPHPYQKKDPYNSPSSGVVCFSPSCRYLFHLILHGWDPHQRWRFAGHLHAYI